ncbi:glycine cleavage system aminomethyltransferase GcvT [uncultured Amnibacterium sp.]|uniref:glycine cleavage system aminomethyltransferase GcvT n=1 Tax=uncultured Amnibacterium sp. TaxID=1631851 RepID=UPI0035CA0942
MTDSEPRRSPLDAAHAAAGAIFTTFAGWRMPLKYGSELAEHAAVRTAAGLFDLSHMGEILVLGPGAAEALDAALPSDVPAIAVGQAKYTLLLDDDGGVLDDLVLYRTGDDRFLVVANAANRALVAAVLHERVAASALASVSVQDESDDFGLLALQGPIALDVLTEAPGFAADEGGRDGGHFADALRALKNYRFFAAWFEGHPVLVARTGYTGELGVELFASPGLLPALWDVLLTTGAGSGVTPVGLAARDTLRLEAGMPLHGNELTDQIRPAQAGLGRLLPPDKHIDYPGRAAALHPDPQARVLVGLLGEGRRAGRSGYPVLAGEALGEVSGESSGGDQGGNPGTGPAGEPVGVVTSGALSPTLGRPIAMAYVDPSLAAVGTPLAIDVRGTPMPVQVAPLPFYRRKA